MPKLNELLAEPASGFGKTADVESPDEVQLEQDFANLAFMFLRDRASGLMPYLLGFEVVDREEDGSRAVGIFGFKISGKYYYVPAFFVNNQVKGMDLLYDKSTNSFMPLRETWINHILNKSTLRLGSGVASNKVREDFEQPNFQFLAEPPVGIKSAGLEHLFSDEELMMGMGVGAPKAAQVTRGPSWHDYHKQQYDLLDSAMTPEMRSGYENWLQSPEGKAPVLGSSTLWRYMHANHPEVATNVTNQLAPLHNQIQTARRAMEAKFRETHPLPELEEVQPIPVDKDAPRLADKVASISNMINNVDNPHFVLEQLGVPKHQWDMFTGGHKYRKTHDLYTGRPLGNPLPAAAQQPKVANQIKDAFDVWNTLQGAVVEGLHKDAEFQQAWAGAIATLKHETLDMDKTADGSPILDYLRDFGGPRAVRSFMRSVQNPKFASALLSFYPDIKSFNVTEFDAALAPKVAAAKVTVVSAADDAKGMNDSERKRLVRDGFSIVDRRDDSEKSQLFDVEFEKRYSNPTESGQYDMLLPTGATVKAWVMLAAAGQPGKAVLCVEPANKFFFTADMSRVFVVGDRTPDKSAYEAGIDLADMEVNRRYALVDEAGNASAPFRVEAATAEAGERVRIRVYFDTSIDHSNGTQNDWPLPGNYATYGSNTRYLQLANHPGKLLRCTGEDLIVPSNWKAVPLTTKWEYENSQSKPSERPDVVSPAPSEARNAYDAFSPGSPIDVAEILHKQGFHKLTVGYEGGTEYTMFFDGHQDGPHSYAGAMTRLVTKYGMSVDDAENTLACAGRNFKSRHLVKLGQLVGANVPMPQPPGPGMEDLSGLGLPTEQPFEETQEGNLLGAGTWQDSTQPGFAVGGQSEQEAALGDDVNALAQHAMATGQKRVFDHASIGGLARMYDSAAAIDMYVPELMKSLDRIGRILFIFYWKNEEFAERYGEEDLAEMEDMLRGVFKSYGDLVLKLRQKAITNDGGGDEIQTA